MIGRIDLTVLETASGVIRISRGLSKAEKLIGHVVAQIYAWKATSGDVLRDVAIVNFGADYKEWFDRMSKLKKFLELRRGEPVLVCEECSGRTYTQTSSIGRIGLDGEVLISVRHDMGQFLLGIPFESGKYVETRSEKKGGVWELKGRKVVNMPGEVPLRVNCAYDDSDVPYAIFGPKNLASVVEECGIFECKEEGASYPRLSFYIGEDNIRGRFAVGVFPDPDVEEILQEVVVGNGD